MRYYIHSLNNNTYFPVDSFEEMIKYFARSNKTQGSYSFYKRSEKEFVIDPKKHHWSNYNSALNHIAMNANDVQYEGWSYDPITHIPIVMTLTQRDIMVKDEMGRTIDPRSYWDLIATFKFPSLSRYHWKPRTPFIYRYDPVQGTGTRRGGRHSKNIATFQERKLSCDPEIKEFINPKRNMMNLPSSWDQYHRNTNHCWKSKKLKHQWMKHQKGAS